MTDDAHTLVSSALLDLVRAVRAAATRVVTEAGDDDALHDFRVALRRLRTLLRVARVLYGARRIRAISEALGAVADGTSELRDEEALGETLAAVAAGERVPESVRSRLAEEQVARRVRDTVLREGVVRSLRSRLDADDGTPRLAPALEDALTSLEARLEAGPTRKGARAAGAGTASSLGRRALEGALADVRAFEGGDVGDDEAMHVLRIRFKRLRYTADLFVEAVGQEATVASKAAARMQKRLGDLHDLDIATARFEAHTVAPDAPSRAFARTLRLARARAAVRCIEELEAVEPALVALEACLSRIPVSAPSDS